MDRGYTLHTVFRGLMAATIGTGHGADLPQKAVVQLENTIQQRSGPLTTGIQEAGAELDVAVSQTQVSSRRR